MALIPCKHCGHQVSTEAHECPQCGAPVGWIRTRHRGCATLILFLLAIYLLSLLMG